jgi:hypothetical protein
MSLIPFDELISEIWQLEKVGISSHFTPFIFFNGRISLYLGWD